MAGNILAQVGPVIYLVRLTDVRIWKRHVDHLWICYPEQEQTTPETDSDLCETLTPRVVLTGSTNQSSPVQESDSERSVPLRRSN